MFANSLAFLIIWCLLTIFLVYNFLRWLFSVFKIVKKIDKDNNVVLSYFLPILYVSSITILAFLAGIKYDAISRDEIVNDYKQVVSSSTQIISDYKKELEEQKGQLAVCVEENKYNVGRYIKLMEPGHYAIYYTMKAEQGERKEEIVLGLGWSKETRSIKYYQIPLACAQEKNYTNNLIILNPLGSCKWLPPNMEPKP